MSGTSDVLSAVTIALGAIVAVNDGATLTFSSTIANSGTISVGATLHPTELAIAGAVALTGGGKVALSNNTGNTIAAAINSVATLTNANNSIAGAGTIGGGANGEQHIDHQRQQQHAARPRDRQSDYQFRHAGGDFERRPRHQKRGHQLEDRRGRRHQCQSHDREHDLQHHIWRR